MPARIDDPIIADLESLPSSAIRTIQIAAYCRMMDYSCDGQHAMAATEAERYQSCEHVLNVRKENARAVQN